jgi:hypothetical protein
MSSVTSVEQVSAFPTFPWHKMLCFADFQVFALPYWPSVHSEIASDLEMVTPLLSLHVYELATLTSTWRNQGDWVPADDGRATGFRCTYGYLDEAVASKCREASTSTPIIPVEACQRSV